MKLFWSKLIYSFFFFTALTSCEDSLGEKTESRDSLEIEGKITGVNLEMPPKEIESEAILEIDTCGAEWIAVVPYGFTVKDGAEVHYRENGDHWWGETVEGMTEIIKMCREGNYKIMMKPHVWVVGAGWPGDFELDTEERWLIWEKSYRKYILRMAEVADSLDVELFCIGTEYRKAAAQRESFWRELIHEVQDIYDGPITYAANWDNYANIKFWDELDYIGIDAYFQLSKKREPSKKVMKKELNKIKVELKDFSEVQDREIIFTEYGYKSVDYLFNGDWESGGNTLAFNESNQRRAYECFFETIWEGDWMKGGFLWKWHLYARDKQTGKGNKRYTPQNKAAQQVIRKYYSKAN